MAPLSGSTMYINIKQSWEVGRYRVSRGLGRWRRRGQDPLDHGHDSVLLLALLEGALLWDVPRSESRSRPEAEPNSDAATAPHARA